MTSVKNGKRRTPQHKNEAGQRERHTATRKAANVDAQKAQREANIALLAEMGVERDHSVSPGTQLRRIRRADVLDPKAHAEKVKAVKKRQKEAADALKGGHVLLDLNKPAARRFFPGSQFVPFGTRSLGEVTRVFTEGRGNRAVKVAEYFFTHDRDRRFTMGVADLNKTTWEVKRVK